jgi:hypothetical protein
MARLIAISAVTGKARVFTLKLDGNSGIAVDDRLFDSRGRTYRVRGIVDQAEVIVADDLSSDGPAGAPSVGPGAVYTLARDPAPAPDRTQLLERELSRRPPYFRHCPCTLSLAPVGASPNDESATFSGGVLTLEPASSTKPGVVTALAQTFGGTKSQVDSSLIGTPSRRLLHPEVNIIDFGADPTGVADSSQHFRDAIDSFSPPGSSTGGTILIPTGTYRIASTIHVKKCIHFKGLNHYSPTSVVLTPDQGVEAFRLERYNTPRGTMDAGRADGTTFENLVFYNPGWKAPVWNNDPNTRYSPGDVVKVGPRPGQGDVPLFANDPWGPYPHYICTQGGTPGAVGPRSLGNDHLLNYTGPGGFAVGKYVVGATSRAEGIVIADTGNQLRITGITRIDFLNGEPISDAADGGTGTGTASGVNTPATTDEPDGTCTWRYYGKGCAIKSRTIFVMRDVEIDHASGCGVVMENGDPEDPSALTNSNTWQFFNVSITTCDGHGLYLRHSDTNGGSWFGGACAGNGGPASDESFSGPGFNLFDGSFLGNTYVGVTFYANGGQGSVYSQPIGGGSTWIGCYQEGTGGGHNVMLQSNIIVGGSMSLSDVRSSGPPTFSLSPTVRLSAGLNYAQIFGIRSNNDVPWRPNVFRPRGVHCVNAGNYYVCIVAGVTAPAGGPTTTGPDIVDGTCHWQYLSPEDLADGTVELGSIDTAVQSILTFAPPDDANGQGLASYFRYYPDSFADLSRIRKGMVWQYGISGPNGLEPDGNGVGAVVASNQTIMQEWPTKIPAGKWSVDMIWLGGSRHHSTGVAADPTFGIWNPGDRIYYKGAACVAGGAEGRICVVGGSAKTYAGTRSATATGTNVVTLSGAAMSSLVDQQEFRVGDWLTVGASGRRHVVGASKDGLTLTLDDVVGPGVGLAMAFSPPTFKEFGRIAP